MLWMYPNMSPKHCAKSKSCLGIHSMNFMKLCRMIEHWISWENFYWLQNGSFLSQFGLKSFYALFPESALGLFLKLWLGTSGKNKYFDKAYICPEVRYFAPNLGFGLILTCNFILIICSEDFSETLQDDETIQGNNSDISEYPKKLPIMSQNGTFFYCSLC